MFWDINGRKKYQEVPVCLLEIKFALNNDIQEVDQQLARYYEPICRNAAIIAEELEGIFKQKLFLGLYDQPADRLNAMKTLNFSREIEKFQFILVLVDYNKNSTLFVPEKLRKLPFHHQIKIFHAGFGMWQENMRAAIHG